MGCRADGMSRSWKVAQMGCRGYGKSRRWNIARLKCRANGMSRKWDIAQLKCRASEKSRKWDVAQLKCRADEISRKKMSRKWCEPFRSCGRREKTDILEIVRKLATYMRNIRSFLFTFMYIFGRFFIGVHDVFCCSIWAFFRSLLLFIKWWICSRVGLEFNNVKVMMFVLQYIFLTKVSGGILWRRRKRTVSHVCMDLHQDVQYSFSAFVSSSYPSVIDSL